MLMKTAWPAVAAVLLASILGAIAPFLIEHGSRQAYDHPIDFLLKPWILGGVATYAAVMVCFSFAFRIGGTVKVLYPVYASTFIWAALIAYVRQGAAIEPVHAAGMALLMAGIFCMSW